MKNDANIHVGEYYTYPAEKWDAAKCAKMAKRTATDGLGTKYHFKGYLDPPYPWGWGQTRLNGGTVIDNGWYEGVIHPLPEVAKGYKIVVVPSWGYQIVKDEATGFIPKDELDKERIKRNIEQTEKEMDIAVDKVVNEFNQKVKATKADKIGRKKS